jgi:hypothetical protein
MSADISFFVEVYKNKQWQPFDVILDTPRMPLLFYVLLGYGNKETKEKYKDIPILCQGGEHYGWPSDVCTKNREFITSEIYNTHAAGWFTLDMADKYTSSLPAELLDISEVLSVTRFTSTDMKTLEIVTCLAPQHIRILVTIS